MRKHPLSMLCCSRRLRSAGFTLIELLTVVVVIGVLMALLLPAVQSARESSRRVECVNNLKQIGLGLNSYVATHGVFPPLDLYSARGAQGLPQAGHNHSPLVRMLNELELAPLYNAVNFSWIADLDASLVANQTAMVTTVAIFVCPSDPKRPVVGYGRVNYRFSIGPAPWYSPASDVPSAWDGPFSIIRTYRPADFPDGLSQTIGGSERLQGSWTTGVFTPGGYLVTTLGSLYPHGGLDWAAAACAAAPPNLPVETKSGESWFFSGLHFTDYNHCATPNAKIHDCSFWPTWLPDLHSRTIVEGVSTASSFHPGGVNVLLMDGSVRFARDSIDRSVWWALSTRTGGETISSDSF